MLHELLGIVVSSTLPYCRLINNWLHVLLTFFYATSLFVFHVFIIKVEHVKQKAFLTFFS
jgi:hypothetical protein